MAASSLHETAGLEVRGQLGVMEVESSQGGVVLVKHMAQKALEAEWSGLMEAKMVPSEDEHQHRG